MTDKQLQYILTIAEEGGITAAADKLHISQPSLSALLSSVEDELGIKLFKRGSPMVPTYGGECYLSAAMETLNIQKELRDRIGDIKNEKEGRLIVGCGENLSAYILPLVMPVFLKNNPKSQIKLIEANASTFENLIKSGKMDLAFTGTPIENPGLESAFLYSEEVLLLVPKKYRVPSAGKSKTCGFPFCDMTALKEMPFILFKPGRYLRHIADKIFEDHHIRPKIFLETNNWATCFRMVEEGMACTFLPHLPLREFSGNGQIERFSVKGGYVRHISICYKKKRYQSRLMQKFIETAGITIKEVLPTSDLLLESVMPQNKI